MLASLFGLLPLAWQMVLLQPPEEEIYYYNLVDPAPEPGLAWFVLNAFFYVAIVGLVTLGLGIFFGGFRVWLKERYPDNPFNGTREEDSQVVLSLFEPAAEDEPPAGLASTGDGEAF